MTTLKKVTVVLAVIAVAGVATLADALYKVDHMALTPVQSINKTTTLWVGTTTVLAEVADTTALRAQGLSNRTSLEEGRGMWFVFEEDGLWSFWMKDTLIPLDMIWVDAEGTIVHIAHDVRPESYPEGFAPATPARYVLEVPAGWVSARGVKEGDKIKF